MAGRTLYDKIWESHAVGILPTGQTQLFIGLHLIHEITTAPAFDMLREKGIDPRPLWFSPDEWIDFGEPLESWIRKTAAALAQAVIAAASIIDFSSVIIDGGFPDWVRTRIVAATRLALKHHDLQGVTVPDIIEGAVGSQARAIGGASLPLFSRYLIDQNVLFKDTTG